MIRARANNQQQQPLELTALIDIIFIVVVFLLLTANAPLLELSIDPPKNQDETLASQQQEPTITIGLHPDGDRWSINRETFSDWASFRKAVIAIDDRNLMVAIAADRKADIEPLLQLLALLNELEFSNTHILMEHNTL